MAGTTPAVFDTNVLVSAILATVAGRTSSAVVRCFEMVLNGEVQLYVSSEILRELVRALQKPSIGLPAALATLHALTIGTNARVVEIAGELRVLERDPRDNHVLECALTAGAAFLVTGNRKHYEELGVDATGALIYQGVQIVTPAEFLSLLGRS